MRLTDKQVLLSRIENTYGNAATLTAADAMLVSNLSLKPATGNMIARQRAYPYFGQSPQGVETTHSELSFDVDLAGSGVLGVPPLYGNLLRSCGMSETIKTDTWVRYAPISKAIESVTQAFNLDGVEQKLTGSRGTFSLKADAGKEPSYSFSYQGLYAEATSVDLEDVGTQIAAFIDPETVSMAMSRFDLHGKTPVMASLQLDLGNKLLFSDKPNRTAIDITGRTVVGKATVEAGGVSAADWVERYRLKTVGPLNFRHGNRQGNVVLINVPGVQVGEPAYTDVNGVLHQDFPLYAVKRTDDAAFTVTVK